MSAGNARPPENEESETIVQRTVVLETKVQTQYLVLLMKIIVRIVCAIQKRIILH